MAINWRAMTILGDAFGSILDTIVKGVVVAF